MRSISLGILALMLAGCGGESPDANHDMHAMGDAHLADVALDPLPDDGVMPRIDVRMGWMRPHPNGRDVTAAYFTVYLAEGSIDRLVSADIEGAERVELHGHFMTDNGMMQMREIGPQEIVAAGPMNFVPGGRHLMVFGLAQVAEGDSVNGTLVFERAGEVDIVFDVRNAPPGMPTEY